MMKILRLGHRPFRDKRITTHVCLVARAFGADRVYYSGLKDESLEKSVDRTVDEWGGRFRIEHVRSWRECIRAHKDSCKVHLTMYGLPFREKLQAVKTSKDVFVIVGGSKVPSDVYQMADYNLSVTLQPHSEVAALAVLLHELFGGIEPEFDDARMKVVPQERGKKLLEKNI